ncbi:MAG: hypothetical protein V7603_5068 [Micromonosporaceae bacterium]
MAVTDRLAGLVALGDWLDARRRLAWAREEIPTRLAELATAATPAARASNLSALAEHHTAVARLHPQPDSPDAGQHRTSAAVYRLLADAEFAAATGSHRHRTNTSLEPTVADILNRTAATRDLTTRPQLLDEMQATLGSGFAATAVAALPRTGPATPVREPGQGSTVTAATAALRSASGHCPPALAKAFDPPGGSPPTAAADGGAAVSARPPGAGHRGPPGLPRGPRR